MAIIEEILRLKDEASPALKKTTKAAKRTDKATKGAAVSMKGMGAASKAAAVGLASASAAAKGAAASMAATAASAKAAAASMATMAGPMLALAAAAGLAGKAVFDLADFASQFADNMLIMSRTTGLAADTLIGLRFAAAAGGGSIEKLGTGLKSFTKRAGDAATKGGEAEIAFTRIGVEVNDAAGEIRDMDAILRDTLDSIAALPTAAQRATAAMEIFGARGAELVAVLGDGSAALDEWTEKARAAGVELDEGLLAASTDMDRAMADLDLSIIAVKLTLGEGFTPAVSASIIMVRDFFTGLNAVVGVLGDLKRASDKLSSGETLVRTLAPLFGLDPDQAAAVATGGQPGAGGIGGPVGPTARPFTPFQFKPVADVIAEEEARAAAGGAEGRAARPDRGPTKVVFTGETMRLQREAAIRQLEQQLETTKLREQFKASADAQLDEQKKTFKALTDGNKLAQEQRDANIAAVEAAVPEGPLAGVADGINTLNAIASGGLVGILGALGPAGAIAGAVIGVLKNLPSILKGLIAELDEIFISIVEGLPQVLGELIPDLITSLAIMLPTLIPELVIAVVKGLGDLLINILRPQEDGVVQREFGEGNKRLLGFLRGIAPQAFGRAAERADEIGFAHGGVVDRTGMALVHQGERITPAGSVMSGTTASLERMTMGGSIGRIDITMADRDGAIRELIRGINQLLGARGLDLNLDGVN